MGWVVVVIHHTRTMEIKLTFPEAANAAQVGAMRHISSVMKGRKDRYGADPDKAWQIHMEGACGEQAAAKALNTHWPATLNHFDKPDIGCCVQVKTRSLDWFDLLVRPSDRDDYYFVLVTGSFPAYQVRGYMLGADAKQSKWLKGHGGRDPAYFVPQKDLQPIEKLRLILATGADA